MAQAKTADPRKDFEELSAQIEVLRNDLGAITETLKNAGVHSGEAALAHARRTASELQARGQEGLKYAQSSAEEMGAQAAQAVRNQPAAAVGLAVGVGFLLGFMSGRK
ncbi:hypothetical protein K1T73_05225 [Roseovarius sp. SCSIO 43702]|uniref:DUF883 family protein n=1 Tax=Roseovarius sp. SCSIO 43702 TaxID=2823043 RepID=UPI001C7351F5|nr:hypothetical protein [Roseovarius sp. SCSIO 43702]QYX57791.1 hypothetical protein K1T73_05225 [Roseovarius sp. SCSIO 43702]